MHRLKNAVGVGAWIIFVEEVKRVFRSVGLGLLDVDDIEREALGETANGCMVGVDELAAPLGGLPLVEVVEVGVHAAAKSLARLVHCRAEPLVGELERAREASDP